ncbi:EAL domain-containing protein [Maridesulfovibrio sp.]|uniref:EAL domain-containing protein n=1 Tax=Maridesulfovibrio sp. TaxID=2795000 RepID=UPI002A187813|nr:EAL domain-containing protein [Maridesulfovibrio sp.]
MESDIKNCITAISKVVTEDGITVLFQPVVSLLSRSVIGFEAFARGVDEKGETIAPPGCLFNSSLPIQAQLKVEELCLKKSLESYKPLYEKYSDMLLYLNINCGVYCRAEDKGRGPHQLAELYKYSPRMIVFEMDAVQLIENPPLEMIRGVREKGYRLCVDNVLPSFDCIDRLHIIKPDFVKIDRKFYGGIEKSKRIKKKLASIATLFSLCGVLPVAKGVETELEAVSLMQSGFYMQQGYFYSDSAEADGKEDSFADKISRISKFVKGEKRDKSAQSSENFKNSHILLKSTITSLQQGGDEDMNRILDELVKKNDNVVSVYILDSSGKQRSKRLAGKAADPFGLRVIPSVVGSDHSSQDYFIYLNSGLEKAAGERCPDALCNERYNYLAGFYYKEGSRRGKILVLEYVNSSQEEAKD